MRLEIRSCFGTPFNMFHHFTARWRSKESKKLQRKSFCVFEEHLIEKYWLFVTIVFLDINPKMGNVNIFLHSHCNKINSMTSVWSCAVDFDEYCNFSKKKMLINQNNCLLFWIYGNKQTKIFLPIPSAAIGHRNKFEEIKCKQCEKKIIQIPHWFIRTSSFV